MRLTEEEGNSVACDDGQIESNRKDLLKAQKCTCFCVFYGKIISSIVTGDDL